VFVSSGNCIARSTSVVLLKVALSGKRESEVKRTGGEYTRRKVRKLD
jgi:hypothetical protein